MKTTRLEGPSRNRKKQSKARCSAMLTILQYVNHINTERPQSSKCSKRLPKNTH